MAQKEIKIETIKLNDLVHYEKNAKLHPEEQINKLKKSIQEFGFLNPILVDKDNIIIAGHGRALAANQLNLKEVPVIRVENLSQEQVAAYRLADNKLNEGEWDMDLVNEELDFLKDSDFDFGLTGFDDFEMGGDESSEDDNLINKENQDELFYNPNDSIETDIKVGQVYELGNHRLMCGDATEKMHVEELMAEDQADLVFTDPPYGMHLNTDYEKGIGQSGLFKSNKVYDQVKGDHHDFSNDLIHTIFINFSYCKEIIIFGADYFTGLIQNIGKGSWMVWDKKEQDKEFDFTLAEFELIWSKQKHSKKILRIPWRGIIGLGSQDTRTRVHPTQKPVELLERVLNVIKPKQETLKIVDLYGGSGSTLIGAEKLGHSCFIMELEPKYCQVIINRWEKLTGKKAERLH